MTLSADTNLFLYAANPDAPSLCFRVYGFEYGHRCHTSSSVNQFNLFEGCIEKKPPARRPLSEDCAVKMTPIRCLSRGKAINCLAMLS